MTLRGKVGGPSLAWDEFEALARFLEQRAGLWFDEQNHYLFERRLSERLVLLGLHNFSEYLLYLEQHAQEVETVFELLTTKETYFYRQEYQLQAFVTEVLPSLVASAGEYRRLTIWSAGCSTGEEAYTLALLLSESELLRSFQVQIVGTDLCQSNIDAARRGEYRKSSFRVFPQEKLQPYFEECSVGYRVRPALKRMCHFSKMNLVHPEEVRAVGRVDVIFCRNVLIYFSENARKQVTRMLFERLLPGGYLFLGHTESLLSARTSFEPVHLSSDLVYRRPKTERLNSLLAQEKS